MLARLKAHFKLHLALLLCSGLFLRGWARCCHPPSSLPMYKHSNDYYVTYSSLSVPHLAHFPDLLTQGAHLNYKVKIHEIRDNKEYRFEVHYMYIIYNVYYTYIEWMLKKTWYDMHVSQPSPNSQHTLKELRLHCQQWYLFQVLFSIIFKPQSHEC